MKEVKAIIQQFKLSSVTRALQEIPGFPGMTVSDCRGFGKEKGKEGPHRVVEDLIDYIPKVRIEIMINDEMVDLVVETIAKAAHTGNPGDGKVFVYDIEKAVRIKTFQHGEEAL
ncbi:MAG: transcriptional regulator [Deltaproteobacteria bacterium GWB2_55_19]|nr:MAG: transcriptional regulator [Deltaproteobacteria bacterium GWB2_55_19]